MLDTERAPLVLDDLGERLNELSDDLLLRVVFNVLEDMLDNKRAGLMAGERRPFSTQCIIKAVF